MPLTLQTTTILAEFVGTKQRWSWYPAGVKIRHLPGKSSRRLGQFGARATRKIALRYSVSVGRSEKPLRLRSLQPRPEWSKSDCSVHGRYRQRYLRVRVFNNFVNNVDIEPWSRILCSWHPITSDWRVFECVDEKEATG